MFLNRSQIRISMIYIFLTVATLVTFWQVNYCGFISIDDPLYVTENTHIMNGVIWGTVRWAFTHIYANFWHPLTMISLMLDCSTFWVEPTWISLNESLTSHRKYSCLLFFVLYRMTKAPWKSAFVAALFAVHPLHVESVAWVAERKDVLSTFFWMLTLVSYVHYVERPRLRTYLPVFTFFALGLMAKPMLVTLPFVLLLLDYWPLQRFGQKRAVSDKPESPTGSQSEPRATPSARCIMNESDATEHKDGWGAGVRILVIEKIPFLALIPIFSFLAYIAQGEGVTYLPWNVKISNAIVSYVVYIGKMVWPANLAVFYPHPGLWPFWQTAGAGFLLVAITGAVILTAKKYPYMIIGWLWFCRHPGACNRDSSNREYWQGGPFHLYSCHRAVHHGGMGRS